MADDESGRGVEVGQAGADAGLFGAPGAADVAQRAEGGGVAAGLGGEVAPEAEHVRPLPELEIGELRQPAQLPAGADHLPNVAGDGEPWQRAGLPGAAAGGARERGPVGQEGGAAALAGAAVQAAVERTGGVGGLGGVLGHVGGHGLVGEFGVSAEGRDLANVELFAPAEFAVPDRLRLNRDADPGGGCTNGVGE